MGKDKEKTKGGFLSSGFFLSVKSVSSVVDFLSSFPFNPPAVYDLDAFHPAR